MDVPTPPSKVRLDVHVPSDLEIVCVAGDGEGADEALPKRSSL